MWRETALVGAAPGGAELAGVDRTGAAIVVAESRLLRVSRANEWRALLVTPRT